MSDYLGSLLVVVGLAMAVLHEHMAGDQFFIGTAAASCMYAGWLILANR